ncbi:MAG: hydroxyethylthiazole kinase [Eggerthellaceae bacterium]|nr:hydroxyethylthiazole kinase [Eggerthellaceae bacterium]
MRPFALNDAVQSVRNGSPLVHCITNYVTVNDCANALLAVGASPIMSDEPADVEDITSICGGLLINIGTLNASSIESMKVAGRKAADLGHPIVLDPVGAGASRLRTETASSLLDELPIAAIRGNMSEVKALAGASVATRGVDVNPDDAVTDENLRSSAQFARQLAAKTGSIVAITGAIDIVADAHTAYAIRNGSPMMGRITGAGCMLSCVLAAFLVANGEEGYLEAAVAAVSAMGLAGQVAVSRMGSEDGNGSYRTYVLDALYRLTGDSLERGALIERVELD